VSGKITPLIELLVGITLKIQVSSGHPVYKVVHRNYYWQQKNIVFNSIFSGPPCTTPRGDKT